MPKRKAYAIVRMTITREFEIEVDDDTDVERAGGALEKAVDKAIEKIHGPFVDDESSDNPDEYEILEM